MNILTFIIRLSLDKLFGKPAALGSPDKHSIPVIEVTSDLNGTVKRPILNESGNWVINPGGGLELIIESASEAAVMSLWEKINMLPVQRYTKQTIKDVETEFEKGAIISRQANRYLKSLLIEPNSKNVAELIVSSFSALQSMQYHETRWREAGIRRFKINGAPKPCCSKCEKLKGTTTSKRPTLHHIGCKCWYQPIITFA